MAKICLDYLLTPDEIKKFEKIYLDVKNTNKTPHKKQWEVWRKTAIWVSGLHNKDEFIEKTIGNLQVDLFDAYNKLIYPYIKKGYLITPMLGTLLGFYRENDLIKHDDDLDLGIDIFDFQKIKNSLWIKSLFKGWKLHTPNWFDKKGNLGFGDHAARLFQMKHTTYSIGNLTFKTRASIDLWPITRVPDYDEAENDRFKFYMHMQNIYKKNKMIKYFDENNQNKYFLENSEFEIFKNEIFKNDNTLLISQNWMKDFYKRSKESNCKIYMPLEKDMPKINNIDLTKTIQIQIRNSYFEISDLNNDENFRQMYGDDWNIEKLTHLHFVRYKTIKKK